MAFNALNGHQPPAGALDINNDGLIDLGDTNSIGEHATGKKVSGLADIRFLGNYIYGSSFDLCKRLSLTKIEFLIF